MLARDLSNEKWTMRPIGDLAAVPQSIREAGDIPARVPGCVHTDLMRAGLIPDPRVGTNELDLLWIGECDWEYRAAFELAPDQFAHERLDLACEGLDTIAELSLNGAPIGAAANMFHPHRFDLRAAARPGPNDLSIIFRSPLKHIRAEQSRLGPRPVNGDWDPYIFIRKAACNFGWDWAPKVATCGIWKQLSIEAWNHVRISDVRTLSRKRDRGWELEIVVDVEWAKTSEGVGPLTVVADLHGVTDEYQRETAISSHKGLGSVTMFLGPISPNLWWPRGHGEQPLYSLELTIHQGEMEHVRWARHVSTLPPASARAYRTPPSCPTIDRHVRHIAFREVKLNTDPDEHGSKFQLEINGTPIFCKGANWISEGLFPDDRPPEKIRERVRQAAAANMNMLRVWGGGFYESDEFYDECDKLGIMVWQDFMFACACYPEEPPFPRLIEAEARHQIARLSSHPSVVLWCGGNECVWGYESWGHAATDVAGPWKQRVGDKTWGSGYYFDLLPRLMRELDPARPYWANSPFAGRVGENPNQTISGDRHTWDATFLKRAPSASSGTPVQHPPDYRSILPRFCSEFGHQSPSNLPTLAAALNPEDLTLSSPTLEHHQKATGGTTRHINEPMAAHSAVPTDFARWHALAQALQAEALRNGIEWHAAHREGGRCMGVLIWQFNDAWPGMSWSLIDSAGTPKPAYFEVQRAFGAIPP